MPLRITIDIFSGRPNPVIELDGAEADEVIARLRPAQQIAPTDLAPLPDAVLGYRGLIVEQLGEQTRDLPSSFRVVHGELHGSDRPSYAADQNVEEFICGNTDLLRRALPDDDAPARLLAEIDRFRDIRRRYSLKPIFWPVRPICRCAPLYEPAWWNDGGQRQSQNNCYNYSTNYRTDTFAQPGRAAGAMYAALTCAAVLPAASADELIDSPNANNTCSGEGHLVALVIAPGWDYHWYRMNRNGRWSHKPGHTPVTNLDNSGVAIKDPRLADRGPYTDFCTFMVVMHGHIKIS